MCTQDKHVRETKADLTDLKSGDYTARKYSRDKPMEPYSENPFRVLGLASTATIKDAARRSDTLLKWIELGDAPPVNDALPFLGPLQLDRDKVKAAKQQVEEPRSRIRSEVFWLSADFVHFDACQKFLRQGQYRDLVAHCEYAISREPAAHQGGGAQADRLAASLARHHLAVFHHSVAIAVTRRIVNSIPGESLPAANWELAFRHWFLVWKDDLFWEYLAQRARLLRDARINMEYLTRLRSDLPGEILNINVALGLEGLERGDLTELASHTRIIKSSPFNQQLKTQACEALVSPLHHQFEKACQGIQPQLSDKAIIDLASTLAKPSSGQGFVGTLDQEKLLRYLRDVELSINQRVLPLANRVKEADLQNTEPGIQLLDGTAYLLRALCLALNNHAGLPRHAWRVADIAHEYAASEKCRETISQDQRTLNYLSLQQDAAELAKARRFRESLTKLEQALQFASTGEDRQTIEQWMVQAKKLLTYEDLKPIDRAPSLQTVNGIGTMLYGRRSFDATTNSYIATLFFTVVFVPIFPIAAYRVIDAGGGMYRFLGKARLSRAAFAAPVIWAFLLLLAIISGNCGDNSGVQNPSSSIPPATAPSEKAELGGWVDRERARIEGEKAELEQAEAQLGIEEKTLKEQRSDLEHRQNDAKTYGSDGPSEYEIDSYNEALQDYKRRAAGLDARERRLQADIEKFNRTVERYNSMR